MSVQVAAITAKLEADIAQFEARMGQAEKSIRDVESSADKASGSGGRGGVGGLAQSMKGVAVVAAAGLGMNAVVSGIGNAVSAASDLDESINALEVAAPTAAQQLLRVGESAAESMGMSRREFNEAGVAFSAFGEKIDAENIGDTFIDYSQRAADFASVMNLPMAEALDKFRSGLAGESEPLRKFGLDLSAASVAAYAVEAGISESASAMTEAEKVQARYGLLMQQTDKFAGDFENTSGSLANQQRTLTANWENAQAALGDGLVPVLESILPIINSIVSGIPKFVTTFESGIQAINRAAQGLADTLNPFASNWSDAEEAMYQFQIRAQGASERLADGVSVYQVAAEWMINLAGEGALTAETLAMIEEHTGASTDEMARARKIADEYGRELGLTEDEMDDLSTVTKDYADKAARDAIAAEEDLAEQARDLAFDTMEAARAQEELETTTRNAAQALLDASDPVYGAMRAMEDLSRTLEEVDEDGHRTNEEMLELARVTLEAESAWNQVDESNINATLTSLSRALGISVQDARDLLAEMGLLDGANPQFTITGSWNIPPPPKGFLPENPVYVTPGGYGAMHTGGIVGGNLGTDEVLKVLQKGEGVIDRDTMSRGLTTAGSTVVNVTVEGSVISERDLAQRLSSQFERIRKAGGFT